MKRDLLIAGVLVVCAGLGICIVLMWPGLQIEDETPKIVKPRPEPVALMPKKEVPKKPTEPARKEPVKLLVEERIDQALTIASVHGPIDADDAPFVVDVAIVAHAVINDPAPPVAPVVDED